MTLAAELGEANEWFISDEGVGASLYKDKLYAYIWDTHIQFEHSEQFEVLQECTLIFP